MQISNLSEVVDIMFDHTIYQEVEIIFSVVNCFLEK